MMAADEIGMDALAQAATEAAASGHVELVVDAAHFQRVVLDGMARARTSLDIATADFKAMMIPTPGSGTAASVVELFGRLTQRGAEVRLMHSGVPSGPALSQLRRGVPEGLIIRRCPRLHAKCVIVDCQAMYLGSANLTGAGLGAKAETRRNFEWGVWTESSELIDRVLEQFNGLWEGRHCDACQRRNLCPVPLEEPQLT